MKLPLTFTLFPLLLCTLHAQQPSYSETVLATPFHVGDSKVANMKKPKPDGRS